MRARHQRVDSQILRADAVERRQRRPQHMIETVGRIGPLQRPEIGDVGDHDDDRGIAPRVGADRAGILGVDIAAGLANLDLVDRHLQRGGKRRHQRLALLDQMQGCAARRTRAESRQPRQQLDQAFDFGAGNRSGHLRSGLTPAAVQVRRSGSASSPAWRLPPCAARRYGQ